MAANGHDAQEERAEPSQDAITQRERNSAWNWFANELDSRTVRSLLVGIAPTDPLALSTAVVVIVAIVGGAAWIPARRATRLSPTVALRVE